MIRTLYTALWHLALPLVLLRLLLRARREPGYLVDLGERLGHTRQDSRGPFIWLHAVSVGETRAAAPLIARLRESHPGHRILLTQMTATGRATARQLYGDSVTCAWLPWDLPWAQRRFLQTWRPDVGIVMETELWPNLLAECARAGVPVVLANARLSERSARRYARAAGFARQMLAQVRCIVAQTDDDARRLSDLGASRVEVGGNIKFDVEPPVGLIERGLQWREALARRPVLLLASTREGEEALLLDALLEVLPPDTLIALLPRHPQRFDEVAALVEAMGLSLVRRSAGTMPDAGTRVWLGDAMGEMFAWYALADLAIIGGSWLPLGGQNLIEACAVGCPVLTGPHTFNFAQATDDAIAAGAALRASDTAEAARITQSLLADAPRRAGMREAGLMFARAHRGATTRTVNIIDALLAGRSCPAADGAGGR